MNLCEWGHEIIPGSFSSIRVLMTDDEGVPVLDDKQEFMYTQLRLPDHRFRLPGNEQGTDKEGHVRWEADPRGTVHSELDPTGLVGVLCDHGLPRDQHPTGREMYPRHGVSWVRAKYATFEFKCVVDLGQERPADLTTPR